VKKFDLKKGRTETESLRQTRALIYPEPPGGNIIWSGTLLCLRL